MVAEVRTCTIGPTAVMSPSIHIFKADMNGGCGCRGFWGVEIVLYLILTTPSSDLKEEDARNIDKKSAV